MNSYLNISIGRPYLRIARKAGLVLAGTALMAVASWVEVPMLPVPMNLQSLAAPLLGILLGPVLGALAVVAWLVEASVGLPVLSGGAAGAHHLVGPTGGYLVAFPLAAAASGLLARRDSRLFFVKALGAILAGNAIILGLGVIWLSSFIGLQPALVSGLYPFMLGALLKSFAGAGLAHVLTPGRRSTF